MNGEGREGRRGSRKGKQESKKERKGRLMYEVNFTRCSKTSGKGEQDVPRMLKEEKEEEEEEGK